MTRARFGSWLLCVALLLGIPRVLFAIGPGAIVIHGGSLKSPMVLRPAIGSLTVFWAANFYEGVPREKHTIPPGLEGRRFFEYDVFWGRFRDEELLKPELASQHGRLYLATADQPATVVLTAPINYQPVGIPAPTELAGFPSGRPLTLDEMAELVAANIPIR